MAVPKRKTSKARRDKRRATHKIQAPRLSVCPVCHQPKRSHEMCPTCKTYKGREVTAINDLKSLKGRVFVNGKKAYVVFATAPPGSRGTEDIEKFLDSFEINQKP